MNRRKAVFSILLGGGGAVAAFSGYKWMRMQRSPDLSFLDNHQNMIADLAEVIIPRTDTPGAKEAGVGGFIIHMVKNICDRKTQNNFIDGLKDMEAYTSDNYGRRFSDLSAADQQKIVEHFRQKGMRSRGLVGKVQNKFLGKSFFTTLKEATVIGYCSSRQGATQELAYDFIPGGYTGCMPAAPNQKAWATK